MYNKANESTSVICYDDSLDIDSLQNSMVGIDLLVCYHIYYTCNRIEVLAKMMESWNNQIKHKSKSRTQQNTSDSSETIVSIIRHHVMVKETMTQLEEIFSPMILAILVSNSFVICMLLMKLAEVGILFFK